MTKRPETVVIRNITPSLDNGRFALKRAVGGEITVGADIFKDGHDAVAAVLKWRTDGADQWRETPMRPLFNDRWEGILCVTSAGRWEFTVEAWGDEFVSWRVEFAKKFGAGQRALDNEILEGARLIEGAALRAGKCADGDSLSGFAGSMRSSDAAAAHALAHLPELGALMAVHADRSLSTTFEPAVPVRVDREAATFAAWYEFFPRSAEGRPDKGSKFRDCTGRIDDAAAMGFDVIYFPPIHPIGETKRKGPNNSLECGPGDPGVPYAIGNRKQGVNGGGHKDVAPELGTLEEFDALVGEIRAKGMEVALDFAINCSPDHPYVVDHPEWFFKRPDGTIKYAENPPKRYEDVYPLNFHNENWRALWDEMRDVVLFWCRRGVGIFRVDNPHTKPVSFWEWLIAEVQGEFPGTVFLSEAFTRPKMMHELAKAGFTQSYTYFTWRNTKWELDGYLSELSTPPVVDFFRPNFFTNTPDILPTYLQENGRQGFLIRAVLAATASPVYGIYSGFELCENSAVPGKEEYLDSEKYQFKGRDWNAPGNIKEYIGKLNWIRRTNRALRGLDNLRVLGVAGGEIVAFMKATPALDNIIAVAVTVDAWNPQSGVLALPLGDLGIADDEPYGMEDLITGERFVWRGGGNLVILNPHERPAHVFRLRRRIGREGGVDLFGWEAPGQ